MLWAIICGAVIVAWVGFGVWILWDMRGNNDAAGW